MNEYTELPTPLFRATQVRELDRRAIELAGIPGAELMERAGRAAFRSLRERWPGARRVAVVCGGGNNAGDGFVVARLAAAEGLQVDVLQVGDPERLRGDARGARERMLAAGIASRPLAGGAPGDPPGGSIREAFRAADVVVDALFGTGLDRAVEGAWAGAIRAINGCRRPVLAVDIPSGLHADTGCVLGVAVRARLTVTFIGLKQGMFTGEGRERCGRIVFDGLDVPDTVHEGVPAEARRLRLSAFRHLLEPRSRTAHKGDFGHVLLIGGAPGFSGAIRLAGEAAARVGAGLVSVAAHPAVAPLLPANRPELMCHGVERPEELDPLFSRATVVAVGPGLGQSDWSRALFAAAMDRSGASARPLVVDADALNLLAARPRRREDWILTPHPGEAARLLGTDSAGVQKDRFAALRLLAERFGGTVLLKGAGSLVRSPDGGIGVCDAGNPGMAAGGMGDVLTGVIAGLLAQRIGIADAAAAGMCLHAEAADRAAAAGERGMLAGDLMVHLRALVNPGAVQAEGSDPVRDGGG